MQVDRKDRERWKDRDSSIALGNKEKDELLIYKDIMKHISQG